MTRLEIRGNLATDYADVYTADALSALDALAPLDDDRKGLMAARIARRTARAKNRERIAFLDPDATIGRTNITVRQARAGDFVGSEIPNDLKRQWIQGTGPGAKPGVS
ncbi:MAG: malate synthase, partial [Vicinamibacterales bacterium]